MDPLSFSKREPDPHSLKKLEPDQQSHCGSETCNKMRKRETKYEGEKKLSLN
jgi:hypothetical protein